MKRLLLLVSLIVLTSVTYAQNELRMMGYARNYTGVLTSGDNDFSVIQNTFDISFEQNRSKVAFKVNPYLYHYFDRDLELGLREAYLDLRFDNLDIRLGKQQIIYGKADGVFITDVVSPKDLREFLLPDFNEIRMGITAAKVSYYFGNSILEAVWSPVFTPTQQPELGSIWAPVMPFPITPTFDYSTSEIKPSLENSEAFLRLSSMGSRTDFEIVGGYYWADDPVMHVTMQMDTSTMQMGLIARPDYHRVGMGGASIGVPIGPVVLRSEGGFYTGRHFQMQPSPLTDGTIEKNYLHYMVGADFSLFGINISSQFIQEYILDHEEGMQNDKTENLMTFLAKKGFLREKLMVEFFAYVGLDNGDALLRPKVSYSFADGFDIQLGSNIFVGTEGRFGQYHNNTMIYTKLRYNF